MTVTYTAQVANCRGLGCFWKLLFRWKGSIYKLLWPNVIVYITLYYAINLMYRFGLDEQQKSIFEQIASYCNSYADLIPLSFVLGFYVNLVVKRWWEMYTSLPSTDTLAIFVSNSIHGHDERCRLMRRTIMRYVNLSYCLILSMVSTRVKKRFPTLDHLVDAGVMLTNEKKIFDDLNSKSKVNKYWMPLVWAGSIVARARKEGFIRDDFAVKTLIDELCNFRSKCGALVGYDWISIPLVYTQVVTLAVYSFFVATLMGRQLVGLQANLYLPVFNFLQFFFYMGWLKVAETLVNPFGEDDDDFETNWLIDRNLTVSYLIVDEMHNEHPELLKDQYWDEVYPEELPHTVASQPFKSSPYMGSTAHLEFTQQQTEMYTGTPQLHKLDEVSEDDYNSAEDDERNIHDGGENGAPTNRSRPRQFRRQFSNDDQSDFGSSVAGSYNVRVSRKPSVISIFQRAFQKDGMGSNYSLRSNAARKNYLRSTSRTNTNAVGASRPHTPTNNDQEEMFKMSDLNLNTTDSKSALNLDNVRPPPEKKKLREKPLNKILHQKKYGNTLSVDQDAGRVSSASSDEEEQPLVRSNVSTPVLPISKPNMQKTSPQSSPRRNILVPVTYVVTSDTALAGTGENLETEEKPRVEEDQDHRPVPAGNVVPKVARKESIRDVPELEPIKEQIEAMDLSLNSSEIIA